MLRQLPWSKTLLTKDDIQPIVPLGVLMELGYTVIWNQQSFELTDPNGCVVGDSSSLQWRHRSSELATKGREVLCVDTQIHPGQDLLNDDVMSYLLSVQERCGPARNVEPRA